MWLLRGSEWYCVATMQGYYLWLLQCCYVVAKVVLSDLLVCFHNARVLSVVARVLLCSC